MRRVIAAVAAAVQVFVVTSTLARAPRAPAAAAPAVSADSLLLEMRRLTGALPAPLGDTTVRILTRYTPAQGYADAAAYVAARAAARGFPAHEEFFLPATMTGLAL